MKIKYRTWWKAIPPKTIKLEIPGWAGNDREHTNGAVAQPWHCLPFIEGSTYGLELIYPFDTETHVTNVNGEIKFEGDFKDECVWSKEPTPPFSFFANGHYGFTSSLDMSWPEDHVLRLEPHPRFFTDTTGNCPIAVPGHLQSWWCKIFFVVFKSPKPGETHIFRKDEPYAQVLIIPKKPTYEIEKMSEEEIVERCAIEKKIGELKHLIAKNTWTDDKGHQFDDKYKQLASVYNKYGFAGIKEMLLPKEAPAPTKKPKMIGRFIKK